MTIEQFKLENSQQYELLMLLKNIIGLEHASNEEFFAAVEAKDNFLDKM